MQILAIVWLAAGAAFAQQADPRPAFEVASIKLNTSGSGSSSTSGSTGQIVFTNVTLKRLIERAWGLHASQLSGPDWLEAVHFDIAAKYPPDSKSSDHALMLRTLLQDRFKLTFHMEPKELSGYALVVAKSGFKLKPVEAGGSSTNTDGGTVVTLKAKGVSMKQFAETLARQMGELVVDQTGVKGVFDFEVRWTRYDQKAAAPDTEAPSLFTALPEVLGVRLQSQKIPVEVLVIDHIGREPTEN